MVLGPLHTLAGGGVSLAKAISEARQKELADLARYVAGELAMETLDVGEDSQVQIQPDAVESILKAWAFTQQNAKDGAD